jgi:hypothetical protein
MKKFLISTTLKLFIFALYGKWTKYIGGKTYRQQNVSEAKCIGGKTYRRQNVSAAKRIGGKMYMLKTYQLQSRWGAENGFYKPLGSSKQVF